MAETALAHIGQLYAIERAIRDEGLDVSAATLQRQTQAMPRLLALHGWLQAMREQLTDGTASAKAIVSVAVWVLSWGTFSLGAYLAGPKGYAWFKGLWQRLIGNRSQNQPKRKTFSEP